jgi:hypothetical protein
MGQRASRALRSKGAAEPQLAAATGTSSGGRRAPLPVVGVGTKRAKSFRHPARGGAAASRKRGPDLAGFASKVFDLKRAFGQEL